MFAGFANTFPKSFIFLIYFPKTHGKHGKEVPSPRISVVKVNWSRKRGIVIRNSIYNTFLFNSEFTLLLFN